MVKEFPMQFFLILDATFKVYSSQSLSDLSIQIVIAYYYLETTSRQQAAVSVGSASTTAISRLKSLVLTAQASPSIASTS